MLIYSKLWYGTNQMIRVNPWSEADHVSIIPRIGSHYQFSKSAEAAQLCVKFEEAHVKFRNDRTILNAYSTYLYSGIL